LKNQLGSPGYIPCVTYDSNRDAEPSDVMEERRKEEDVDPNMTA
jgi:hypothetical protein